MNESRHQLHLPIIKTSLEPHIPTLPSPYTLLTNKSSTDASLFLAISYNIGNTTFRGSSPHQWSCQKAQNWTLFPQSTSNRIFSLKFSHPFLLLLHRPQPCEPLPNFKLQPPHSFPNSHASTCLHNLVSSTPNLHNHFPIKLCLMKWVSWSLTHHKQLENTPYPTLQDETAYSPYHPTGNLSATFQFYSPY